MDKLTHNLELQIFGMNRDLRHGYRLRLSINESALTTSPVVTKQNPLWMNGLGLSNAHEADAKLCLNSENELVIEKTQHSDVMITRFERKYHLKSGKSIVLFKNDMISIGNSNIEITGISKVFIPVYRTSAAYWRILSTIAAMITLCYVHSVAYGQTTEETSCKEGYSLCIDNNAYQCVNHQWKLIEECKKPSQCYNGDPKPPCGVSRWFPTPQPEKAFCKYTEPCTNDQYMCYDYEEMYKCVDNKWVLDKKCSCLMESETEAKCDIYPCPMGMPAFFDECEDDEMKCDSETAIMVCYLGKWRYQSVCHEPMVCKRVSNEKAKCEKAFWLKTFQDIIDIATD